MSDEQDREKDNKIKVVGQNGFPKTRYNKKSQKGIQSKSNNVNYNYPKYTYVKNENSKKTKVEKTLPKEDKSDIVNTDNKLNKSIKLNCNSTTSSLKSYYKQLEEENLMNNSNSYDTIHVYQDICSKNENDNKFIFFIEKYLYLTKYVFMMLCLMIFILIAYFIFK